MHGIPREEYLREALKLLPREKNLCQMFAEWLPAQIIDAHAHCTRPEDVLFITEQARRHMLSTFPAFTLEESLRIHALFYPGKQVKTLRFAKTFKGVNHRAANAYLLQHSPAQDRIALFGLPEDISYTCTLLAHPRVSALKMYYSYLEPPAKLIYKYFRPAILEEAQARNIPIILHLPRMLTQCGGDLQKLLNDFPHLIVVLAHLGLPHLPVPGLMQAYRRFAKHDNLFMDTAMIPSTSVVKLAVTAFGTSRIMYGSDEPLNLVRSVLYQHPIRGQRLATEYPYHWVDPEEHAAYRHLAIGCTHTHWQALTALKEAIDSLPASERNDAKAKIFHNNARLVYGF